MTVVCICTTCGRRFDKERSQLNRALKASPGKLFCSLKCSGASRRKPKLPLAERKARKAAYDAIRRSIHGEELRAQKRELYHATKSYEKGVAIRARQRELHGEHYHRDYCRARYARRPQLKVGKRLYDRRRRYKMWYGPLAGAAWVLWKLEREISSRYVSGYERRKARGYYSSGRDCQQRKRNAQISRW